MLLQWCWVIWEQVAQASCPGLWLKENFLEEVLIVLRLEGWVGVSPVGHVQRRELTLERLAETKSRKGWGATWLLGEFKEPVKAFKQWSDMIVSFQTQVKTGSGSQVRRLSCLVREESAWKKTVDTGMERHGFKQKKAELTIPDSCEWGGRGCGEWLSGFRLRQWGTLNAIHWDNHTVGGGEEQA